MASKQEEFNNKMELLNTQSFKELFPNIAENNATFNDKILSLRHLMRGLKEHVQLKRANNYEYKEFVDYFVDNVRRLLNSTCALNNDINDPYNKKIKKQREKYKEFIDILQGISKNSLNKLKFVNSRDYNVDIVSLSVVEDTLTIGLKKNIIPTIDNMNSYPEIKHFTFPLLWFTNREQYLANVREQRLNLQAQSNSKEQRDVYSKKLHTKLERKISYLHKEDKDIIKHENGTPLNRKELRKYITALDQERLNSLFYPYDAVLKLLNLKEFEKKSIFKEEIQDNFLTPLEKILNDHKTAENPILSPTDYALYLTHKSTFEMILEIF